MKSNSKQQFYNRLLGNLRNGMEKKFRLRLISITSCFDPVLTTTQTQAKLQYPAIAIFP